MKILNNLILAIFLVSMVSASTTYHNNTIEKTYSVGEKIRGMLNVSFQNVPADSYVETGWGDKIGLKYLLNANNYSSPANYTCSPGSCSQGYASQNVLQSFNLNNSIGFVLQGTGVTNVDLSIKLTGNIGDSCSQALSVDFGGLGTTILANTNYTQSICSTSFGCFEQNQNSYVDATIPWNSQYCERMNVTSPAPALKMGAIVTNSTIGTPGLTMKIFSLNQELISECTLPILTKPKQGVECLVKYGSAVPKEYFVCIQAKGQSNYKIRTEVHSPCGTENFGGSYPIDYEILLRTLSFGSPSINITKDTFLKSTGKNLAEFISEYLSSNYGSSCSPSCVIPLVVTGKNQKVTISNSKVTYNIEGAQGLESTKVYNLTKSIATINSNPLMINLAYANFTVPSSDNGELVLKIAGQTILTKDLDISTTFSFDIEPVFAAYGKETIFKITGNTNVTSAKWDFGDGSGIQAVSGSSAKHTFLKEGNFDVSVEATKSNSKLSKRIFSVFVGNIKDAINQTIKNDYVNLVNVDKNLSGYPLWIKSAVSPQINITSLNNSLNKINEQYLNATNDTQYLGIYSSLIALKIPESLSSGNKGTVSVIAGAGSIDVSLVESLGGQQNVDDTALRGAITSWMLENSNSKVSFESLDLRYSTTAETFATKFKVETLPKTTKSGSLFIGYPKNAIIFAGAYDAKEVGTGTYIPLKSGSEVFEFIIMENLPVEQLGAYISPSLSELGDLSSVSLTCNSNGVCDSGENSDCSDCSKSKIWPYVLAAIVLILGVGGYFLLRLWYSKYYEQKLFKNRQDLINMIMFIINSRRAQMDDADIMKKLKIAGWSSEKINYAFKKVNSKPKSDARFIKR